MMRLKMQKFLDETEKLKDLSEEELREAFNSIAPKSDWERFFSGIIALDVIKSLLDTIRNSRNNIAHCKFFYRDEYLKCRKAMKTLDKEINKAIRITETDEFQKKNTESMRKSLKYLSLVLDQVNKSIETSMQPISEILSRIAETISKAQLK